MMEILRAAGERGTGGIPAHRHNVEEWSNLDPYGGILEHKRVETDHWANKTNSSSHQYGKVVDSRARNLADGTREQMKQMKQLEVFQARVPGGGSVQVIRSHTSTTSSKISGQSWTNSRMIDTSAPTFEPSSDFDNLKLSIMPLNLNSEKAKISLGRSGSMTKRRPPTRPRSLLCSDDPGEVVIPLSAPPAEPEVPKAQPAKQPAPPKMKLADLASNADRIGTRYTTPSVKSIKSEMGKSAERYKASSTADNPATSPAPYKSPSLVRNESLKSPKIFRSLINKKTPAAAVSDQGVKENEHRPLEAKKSVSTEDISQDYDGYIDPSLKRSSVARRSLNLSKDHHWSAQHTNELENVFKKVLKNKTFYNRSDLEEDELAAPHERIPDLPDQSPPSVPSNKKSFVSVETIQNIRSNLKSVEDGGSRVTYDATNSNGGKQVAENYDEESARVKNYNTGSLENRQNRNEEWYNRRKSYGFEQMKDINDSQHSTGHSLKNIESSTDSGIAKSNENIDTLVKKGIINPNNDLFEVRRNSLNKSSKIYNTLMSLRDSNKKSDFENSVGNSKLDHVISIDQYGESKGHAMGDPSDHVEFNEISNDTRNEPLFITIKPKEEHTSVISIPNKNEMKVESTMVDEGEYFRKVKEIYDKGAWSEDKNGDSRKPKKVEFSKTEVHFEPGKVNIIETNEKPPPVNYRRRKKDRLAARNTDRAERNHAEKVEKQNEKGTFPETKFGDDIKKAPIIALPYEPKVQEPIFQDEPTETHIEIVVDEMSEDESKRPKSILKSGKIDETTNENVDQSRTDFQKILNSFKTSERQNNTASPPMVDNGLKVRISSAEGNNQFDQRRASWCVPESGNKYSTKINFGADNITVLPQKTRYSYCEPSERTIQSLCSQSTDDKSDDKNDKQTGSFVENSSSMTPKKIAVSADEYSRFRTKSPLSSITRTILNAKDTVPIGSNGFICANGEKTAKTIDTNHQEGVPRRRPEGSRSNDLNDEILNRYSYTETSKSPLLSKRSPRATRYSYVEPAANTSEKDWYQHERTDLGKINSHDKHIVRIGSKTHSNDKCQINQLESFSIKQIPSRDETNVANKHLQSDFLTVSQHNDNLKSTKLVLQANDKAANGFPSTSLNNSTHALRPFQVVRNKENRCEKNDKIEINSRTFLENVVAKPIESFINKSQSLNDSSLTNNLRASSNVLKSNSFPCSSKMITSSTFPSYRKSYLIAIGAENEIHKDSNTKTYPRRKDRSDMNVKLLELNKELPPRSPSKQFLSISFDNILDGKLLKNNDLTEPSPLIVPLNGSKSSNYVKSMQHSYLNGKKFTEDLSSSFEKRDSENVIKIMSSNKCPTNFDLHKNQNGISYSSDTSTESSLVFESHRHCQKKMLNTTKSLPHHSGFSDSLSNFEQKDCPSINKKCDNKETVQNDLIPSVLSDLDNLSKSIDEEIFDIPNKVKRRPSILDDDIYCLETSEKNVTRRHKHCYKCNYDKDHRNFENESKHTKRLSNHNGKYKVNSFQLKSDEEYRKTSIKHVQSTIPDIEGLKSKINCKKKTHMVKIKSIEDLKINRLINTINKSCQNASRSPTNKNKQSDSYLSKSPISDLNHSTNESESIATSSRKVSDGYLKSLALKSDVTDETLSNELERLTNEFKRSISSKITQNSVLSKVFSENEIYDLMNSEKFDKSKEINSNSLQINSSSSHKTLPDISEEKQSEDSLVSQTRCDNFKHDFNHSKFKLINGNTSKRICDTHSHKKDSLRSSLLRNRKPSLFSPRDDGELSDDSLKADEEVRSLLRQTEERNNTEVEHWNGGASSHSITTNHSITSATSNQTNIQISTATTNNIKAKNQFSLNSDAPKPAPKKESTTDAVQITSISLHYEPKPLKVKTFQPVCLIYKSESPTNKIIQEPDEKSKTKHDSHNVTSKSYQSKAKNLGQEKTKEVKKSNREISICDQRAQSHRITNELKQINDAIKISNNRNSEKVTRRTDKAAKDEEPKRPARKVKENPIYEKIHTKSKKDSERDKDGLRLNNSKEHSSLKSSGRDGWLNIPKGNGHMHHCKDSKVRSRDSSVESNHTLTNRSRTSSISSNIRSRTSSLESNSQLHSVVLLKSRNPHESEQRSRTSSIDSNRSTNLRNTSRVNSNNSTPVRSRTSSIESNRSYQGINKPKSDFTKSRLTVTQTRRYTSSQTRDSSVKPLASTENKRCTKQLLQSANKGICPKELSSKSKQYLSHTTSSRSRNSSADSTILEELTKAADEILLAVNGYTDEDSIRGSDDERKRRKSYKPLTTIAETPSRMLETSKRSRKSETPVIVRENVYSNVKNQRKSSLENNNKSNARTTKPKAQENIYANIKSVKSSSSSEKVSKKKIARMQRSSSREILESSSDEEHTQDEIKNKKLARRSKGKTNTNMEMYQDKNNDKVKPRSSSVIRSVANHIIETVSPVLADKEKNSTDKKASLKTALFSKHTTNGTKASSRHPDNRSTTTQNHKSCHLRNSSSIKKK